MARNLSLYSLVNLILDRLAAAGISWTYNPEFPEEIVVGNGSFSIWAVPNPRPE